MTQNNKTLRTWNSILSVVLFLLFVGLILSLNALDKEKNKAPEYTADISNYQDWGKWILNQTEIDYINNETKMYVSFYETGSAIGSWYVGRNDILNKTIYLDFDWGKKECSLTIYKDFIEGKGNPEENYIIIGNMTNSSGFSFGRTR